MKCRRNNQGQRQKAQLASHQGRCFPGFRPADAMSAATDSPSRPIAKVIVKLPLGGHQPVEQPQIIVLKAMEGEPRLMRGQPAKEANVDVVVVFRNVCKLMM